MWIFGIANELEIGSVSVEVSKVWVPFSSLSIADLAQLEAVLLFVAKVLQFKMYWFDLEAAFYIISKFV